MGLTPACNSIQQARWYVDHVGRKNIGIALDALTQLAGPLRMQPSCL